MVRAATHHMTSDEANLWFCTNAGNHTIFKRQRDSVILAIPRAEMVWEEWWNQNYHCEKWLARGGGKTVKALEAISNQTLGG
jgi:hypothetical protein